MTVPFWLWKAWNRTRYYWPQAQTRKRTRARIERDYRVLGYTELEIREIVGSRPWWLP